MSPRRAFVAALMVAFAAAGCAGHGSAPSLPVGGGDVARSAAPAPAGNVTLPEFREIRLDNGIEIVLLEKRDVPLVGIDVAIRSGSIADEDGLEGTASLLAGLLEKGAGRRDAPTFAEAVERVGGRLSAGAGLESVTLSGEFMARDAALMIELAADMILRPTLDPAEFDKLKNRRIQLIRAARDADPRALIATYGEAFLFDGHRYGRPVGGSETTLAAIGIDAVRRFYLDHVGADRTLITVAGDFDAGDMESRLRDAFGGMPTASAAPPAVSGATPVTGTRVLIVDKPDATQSYFWIGNVGVGKRYPARAELDLANTVFGGRFTSMLNTELRIKSGLSYGAQSRLVRPTQPGSVAIVSFTATDTTAQAIELALETLERLHAEGLSDEALASARNYVLGQYPLGFETASQLAAQLLALKFYGLGRDWVDGYAANVARADRNGVRATIADVYPRRENLALVVIGRAADVREALSAYGPVVEMAVSDPHFSPPVP